MKPWWVLAALCLVGSCGIETVSTLPAPDVNYQAEGMQKLTLTHSASRYSGTDFQGYAFYYRIYPYNSSYTGVLRLAADVSNLNSGNLAKLTSLGYLPLAQSSTDALVVTGLSDGDVVSLDFTDFLATTNLSRTDVPPVLKINGTTKASVLRTISLPTSVTDLQNFWYLRQDTTTRSDMSAVWSAAPYWYEVEVFVVAFGLTATIQPVNSVPIAWGSIQYVTQN